VSAVAPNTVTRISAIRQQARKKRSESMIADIAAVALGMFAERGFSSVTIDDIAAQAEISIRTFYRYFSAKEDLLQVMIRQRAAALAVALAARPREESPLRSLRLAVEVAVSAEDQASVEQWIRVVADAPNALRAVMGGNILEMNATIAEFLASRFGMPSDALVPITLAVAAGAVIQNAQTRWHFAGGDLATSISEALQVLEEGFSTDIGRRTGVKKQPKQRVTSSSIRRS